MHILDAILRLEGAERLAIICLAMSAIAWLAAMTVTLFSTRSAKRGLRRIEIAAAALALLLVGSLMYLGHAFATPVPPPETPEVSSGGGGTGTCASIRPGMVTSEVRTLLGTPSLERDAEDTMGPGAKIMVFDDSRCVVYLLNGRVDQIE